MFTSPLRRWEREFFSLHALVVGFLPSPYISRTRNRCLDRAKTVEVRALWLCKSLFYSTRPLKWAHAEVPTITLIFDPMGGGSLTFGGPGGDQNFTDEVQILWRCLLHQGAPYIRSPPCTAKKAFFWDTLLYSEHREASVKQSSCSVFSARETHLWVQYSISLGPSHCQVPPRIATAHPRPVTWPEPLCQILPLPLPSTARRSGHMTCTTLHVTWPTGWSSCRPTWPPPSPAGSITWPVLPAPQNDKGGRLVGRPVSRTWDRNCARLRQQLSSWPAEQLTTSWSEWTAAAGLSWSRSWSAGSLASRPAAGIDSPTC